MPSAIPPLSSGQSQWTPISVLRQKRRNHKFHQQHQRCLQQQQQQQSVQPARQKQPKRPKQSRPQRSRAIRTDPVRAYTRVQLRRIQQEPSYQPSRFEEEPFRPANPLDFCSESYDYNSLHEATERALDKQPAVASIAYEAACIHIRRLEDALEAEVLARRHDTARLAEMLTSGPGPFAALMSGALPDADEENTDEEEDLPDEVSSENNDKTVTYEPAQPVCDEPADEPADESVTYEPAHLVCDEPVDFVDATVVSYDQSVAGSHDQSVAGSYDPVPSVSVPVSITALPNYSYYRPPAEPVRYEPTLQFVLRHLPPYIPPELRTRRRLEEADREIEAYQDLLRWYRDHEDQFVRHDDQPVQYDDQSLQYEDQSVRYEDYQPVRHEDLSVQYEDDSVSVSTSYGAPARSNQSVDYGYQDARDSDYGGYGSYGDDGFDSDPGDYYYDSD